MGIKERIEAGNAEAARRIIAADPVLVDVAPASEVIPGMRDLLVLHSGPPVDWKRMCGAQKGAAIGMLIFEGWAKDASEAVRLIEGGNDHAVDADVRRREQGFRQPGLLPAGGIEAAVRRLQS